MKANDVSSEYTFPVLRNQSLNRSPGIHLSAILWSVRLTMFKERYLQDDSGGKDGIGPRMMELGCMWEEALEREFAASRSNIFRPGEFVIDGVACSPDGLEMNGAITLHEFKATNKSRRTVERELLSGAVTNPSLWYWMHQIRFYLYATGSHRARLHVIYMHGSWGLGKGMFPEYRVYDLDFDQGEVEGTVALVLANRQAVIDELEKEPNS